MKNIAVLGFDDHSTLLIMKLERYAADFGFECRVWELSSTKFEKIPETIDIILFGHQLRFMEKTIREKYSDKLIIYIDNGMLASMNIGSIMQNVIKLSNNKDTEDNQKEA